MKHRADVLQIERPGGTQTGGRHAVPVKEKQPKAAKTPKTARGRRPQTPEPGQDPRLDVVAGEEGTLAGDVVEVAGPAGPAPLGPVDLAVLADTAASAVLETVAATLVETEPAPVAEARPARTVAPHHPAEAAEAPTDEERAASPLTSTGKWRTRNLLRHLTFVLLIASAVATGLAARYYFESTTSSRMRLLITSCLLVAGLWALLTATAPQVVTLKGSVLTVKSRRGTDRFDLAEGMQQLELIGDPTSSKWALVLHRGDNTVVRLGRRDVDARTIDPLVRKFREIAERRRSEHWARMGL